MSTKETGELSELSISQKRIWYAREQLMSVLSALGLPAGVLDGSHTLIRGVKETVKWLLSASDSKMYSMVGGSSPEYSTAMALFKAGSGFNPEYVETLAPTGFSIKDGKLILDGCALRVHIGNEKAFIIPVSRTAMIDGIEFTELVALVPINSLDLWMKTVDAAQKASRSIDASRQVMRVFNGSDVKINRVNAEELILDDAVKADFMEDLLGFLSSKDWYISRGISWKQSYLLAGPPGTGKTSLARWASTNLDMPTLSFDFTDPYADGRTLTRCIEHAASMAPCLLVLDDIDKVLAGNNRSGITVHSIQTALSGMGSMDGIVTIATCNSTRLISGSMPDGTDNPLARRFDKIITVGLPSGELKMRYASRLLEKDGVSPSVFGSSDTDGWSYDDIRASVTAAANITRRRGSGYITEDDLNRGVKTVIQRRGGFRGGPVEPSMRAEPTSGESEAEED